MHSSGIAKPIFIYKSYVQNVLGGYAFCVEVSLAVQVRKIMRTMNQQS